jgi:hypothetical protein
MRSAWFRPPDGDTQVRHRAKPGVLTTPQGEYRVAAASAGAPLAAAADNVQLGRDVPKR